MMDSSLFKQFSLNKHAEIAKGIVSFLIKNQPTISLPTDQEVIDEIYNTRGNLNEGAANGVTPESFFANQINKLAIEYLKAYFEVSLDCQFYSDKLVNMIHYHEQLNNMDASQSTFTITFLQKSLTNPTEKELFELEEQIEQHGYYVLNLA